jgi:hypothetical protein
MWAIGAQGRRELGFAIVIAFGLVGMAHAGGTVVVEPVGSATANGDALLATMAGITDASDSNRYVIKIGPGVYDLGGDSLVVKRFVGLEGTGSGLFYLFPAAFAGTTLTSTAPAGTIVVTYTAVVTGLQVLHSAGGPAIAFNGPLDIAGSFEATLTDLLVDVYDVSGGALTTTAIRFRPGRSSFITNNSMNVARARVSARGAAAVGIECVAGPYGGHLGVRDSFVVALPDSKATGVAIGRGCGLEVRNADVSTAGGGSGIRVGSGSSAQILHSRVSGSLRAVSTSGSVEVFSSVLGLPAGGGGTLVGGTGVAKCAGNVDRAMTFFASTCP